VFLALLMTLIIPLGSIFFRGISVSYKESYNGIIINLIAFTRG